MTLSPSFGRLTLIQTLLTILSTVLITSPWIALQKQLQGHVVFQPIANSLCWFGDKAFENRDFVTAERLLRASLKSTLGDHSHDAGYSYAANNLAFVLDQSGRFEEALSWRRQALAINRITFGPDTRESLSVMNNVACELQWLGQLKESQTTLQQALQIERSQKNADKIETGATLNLLSELYETEGLYQAAEDLTDEGLSLTANCSGYTDYVRSALLETKASLSAAEGDFAGAVNLQKLVRGATDAKESGVTGEQILRTTMGLYYAQSGLTALAEPICREALASLAIHTQENPFLELSNSNKTAYLCSELGHYQQASKLFRHVAEQYEKRLGAKHPATLIVKYKLAELAYKEGQYHEAETRTFEILRDTEIVLGAENAEVARALDLYGHICEKTGRCEDALYAFESAYQTRTLALGKEAPFTRESEIDCERLVPIVSCATKGH